MPEEREPERLFNLIEWMKRGAVLTVAQELKMAVERGLDARQGLEWLMPELTAERIWEKYLELQEHDMNEKIDASFYETMIARKGKGKWWHRLVDGRWTWCAEEYDDKWVMGELPAPGPLCEKCESPYDAERPEAERRERAKEFVERQYRKRFFRESTRRALERGQE